MASFKIPRVASLTLRGDVWHLLWRWRGKLKSKSTKLKHDGRVRNGKPVPTAEAKRELRKLENSLEQGRSYSTKTLSDLLELVEKEYAVAGYRSAPSLKSRLEHIREWFGNLRADQVNETDFLEYQEFRKRPKGDKAGAANDTINRELEVVMKALGMGKVHPLPKLTKLPAASPRQGFFDDAKIIPLVRHLPEYLRGPTMFGYYTGWRREEVFGLERKDVDFVAGEVRLWESKNDTARIFPMDVVPGLRSLLEAILLTTVAPSALTVISMVPGSVTAVTPRVFVRKLKKRKTVRPITEFRKAWATACRKAGCPGMLFHDLRRSAARNLELAGWPRSMIMQWMGHETEAMFHRYRIVSAADRAIVSRMLEDRKRAESK